MQSRILSTTPLLLALCLAMACDQSSVTDLAAQESAQSLVAASATSHDKDLVWGPAPPVFAPGAQIAVVQGDPGVPGALFTVRLRFPNGYIVAPHWHPTDENITVLRGTLMFGFGDTFTTDGMVPLRQNDFVQAQAQHHHFVQARGETEVQIHAIGPFQLTYVNPADDPSQ